MTRIDIEFAVIGLINQKLEQRRESSGNNPIEITDQEILAWTRAVEIKSGLAVLNNFCPDDIDIFLTTNQYRDLFRRTYHARKPGQKCYELITDGLRRMPSYPNITTALMERMDPRLNYPMPVIEASGLLKTLESKD